MALDLFSSSQTGQDEEVETQETQFVWMLGTLSDLYKVHPAEDELLTELLVLGISKAVSVVGFLEPDLYERLRKGLESGLRSGQLSSRAACVHSLLYPASSWWLWST